MKLSHEDQIKYCNKAMELVRNHDITLTEACCHVCESYDLPISPKTLRNLVAINKKLFEDDYLEKKYDEELAFSEVMNEATYWKKKFMEAENRNQVILCAIERSVKSLPSIRVPYKVNTVVRSPKARKEIAMLELSDVHLGKKMDARDTAGICSYDINTFEDQCNCIVESIGEILEIQRTGGVHIDKLFINSLGDLVDGEMIYAGHSGEVFMRTSDQIFQLGDYLLRKALIPIFRMFKEVHVMSVDGNHGRVGGKKDGFDRKLNFDGFLMLTLRQRLQNDRDWIHFHISQSPFMIYELFGKYHCLSHGANSGSARSPLVGMERYLTSMSMLSRNIIDYLHLAHFHRELKFNFNFSEILVNGSWLGPTEFSIGKMTAGDFPQQLFYGINRKHITWRYPLYLDKHIHHNCNELNNEYSFNVITPITPSYETISVRDENNESKYIKPLVKSLG